MAESPVKSLLGILNSSLFQCCADCGQSSPDYASQNLGIFVCQRCAEIHKLLGPDISLIKSIKHDEWDYDLLKNFNEIGNEKSNETYENCVPIYYLRPTPNIPFVLREQWIRAKYERREFVRVGSYPEPEKITSGILLKKGKKDNLYREKIFCLSEIEGTLKYFNNEGCQEPKCTIHIDDLETYITPPKMDKKFGMQLTYPQNGNICNIYVCGKTSKETVDWYMTLRSIQLIRLRIAYPSIEDSRLLQRLTYDFILEGWLHKSGPKISDAFRHRWFSLGENKCRFLRYFDSPLDAFAKGEIIIGSLERGYKVLVGLPPNMKDPGNSFTLITPKRNYHFSAKNDEIMNKWVEKLKLAIAHPIGL